MTEFTFSVGRLGEPTLSNFQMYRKFDETNLCCSYQYIEDIQSVGMNMSFISPSEAQNSYFIWDKATNEICIFSLHEMK